MRIRFNSVTGNALMQEHMFMKKIELAQIKRQIEVLATFLPDEILKLRQSELRNVQNYVGVLLAADVTGLTVVTEKYNKVGKGGIYRLTAVLNAYIGAMVEVLYFYGGDVLKFSGSGFLAVWKVMSDDCLFEILNEVVVCALVMQQSLGRFETEVNVEFRLKLAVSCGNMTFSVIGDVGNTHYVIVGDALHDIKSAISASLVGEVTISPGAWSHMLQERYDVQQESNGFVKVANVIYKPNEEERKVHYDEKHFEVLKLIEFHINHKNQLQAKRTFDSNLTDNIITEQFIKSLPPRPELKLAPRHWNIDDLRGFIIKNVLNQVDESQPVEYLTEMREITIQFINITTVAMPDTALVKSIDRIYKLLHKLAGEVLGIVNKVWLFQKDIMVLVLFGLRGIDHEMESQNALKSGYKIKNQLQEWEEILQVSVAVSNGLVYCGVVGHPMRREYNIIGSAAKKAARLIWTYEGRVTCDLKTYKHSKLASFYFILLKATEDESDTSLIDYETIFEYNEEFDETKSGKKEIESIIGRNREFNLIRKLIYDPPSVGNYYGVCLHGLTTIGKTALLRHLLNSFMNATCFNIASIELEGSSNIPYFCIMRVYRQLYDNRTGMADIGAIKNLPRDLNEVYDEMNYNLEDFALQKYRMLNFFRDITNFLNDMITVIFIDNFEHIDLQSWEILEIVFNEKQIRLVLAASFDDESSGEIHFKASLNDYLKLLELGPIEDEYIPALTCQLLDAAGIPKILVTLLTNSCEGLPGSVQTCLLHLINSGCIEMRLINKEEANTETYLFPRTKYLKRDCEIIPIVVMSEKYKSTREGLTLAAISLDLFDSFSPFQQLVIKTASVLGDLFTRTLLMVALKYPVESAFIQAIKELFEEEVFDCGSRYVYATDIDTQKLCCKCYFEDDYFMSSERSQLPKYAFCKILHFKNKSIRDVAYDLLPGNQRKELHLLCTNVLENISNQCPSCLREPTVNFLNFYKFKDIMSYCNNPSKPFNSGTADFGAYDNIKESVKRAMLTTIEDDKHLPQFAKKYKKRPVYDRSICKCVEIFARVFKDLIYHSEQAGHLGKRIFYTMQFGLLLLLMFDYGTAISVLTEARELCMNDAGSQNVQITDTFRKFHVGKIEMGMAKACLELHQLTQAKGHLTIALRQYNIPSMALHYKMYSKLLTRSFLVNIKRMRPFLYKNTIARCDMGTCLAYCSKLFYLEGKWSLAKLASTYSIYLLKTVNINIPILFEVYCNVIDIYRVCNDTHVSERLHRSILKEIQFNYAANITNNLAGLILLMSNYFYLCAASGNICAAIRFGFRAIDVNIKVCADGITLKMLGFLSLLLAYNFRIRDSADVCKMLINMGSYGQKNIVEYYDAALSFYLRTGFIVEPFNNILTFAQEYIQSKLVFEWSDHFLFICVKIQLMRMGKYALANEIAIECVFNESNVKIHNVLRILLHYIELRIYMFVKKKRDLDPKLSMVETDIKKLIKLAEKEVKNHFRVMLPLYYCLIAWFHRVRKLKRQSEKFLKKSIKICEKQENILFKCYILQLRNAWAGGFAYSTNTRPQLDYRSGRIFTLNEWAQFMIPFPIDI